ncbi:hypothetical protein CPLU01_09461 [Colletotrichum plurivorum]|uniref:6-phosphogluconate dehydrogenase NADP-binding domain-containing protein n=1 Tax=Colletotrichum plurivorum TaxID=2175906 RepID=A0A8H6K9E0_9PEZI|nr:hypothetical protein CPLU01_09461 [Colletotrichum plurivorum]
MSKTDVTIVGVGNIGAAMAGAWLDSGLTVTMWNRSPDRPKLMNLVRRGAKFELDLRNAVMRSDVVVICVSTYANIKEFFSPILPLEQPTCVINITTGTSQQARDMETWLKSNGVRRYFDGAIMVTPELVGTEHSSMYLSGESEAGFSEIHGVLKPLGKSHYVAEDSGAASLWDVAALAAMNGMLTGGIVALNLLKRQRPDRGTEKAPSTEAPMRQIVLPLLSTFVTHLADIARALDEEDWNENFGNSVAMQLKGLGTIMDTLREEKVSTEGLELFHRLMQRTLKEKGEGAGLAAMGTYLLED